MSDDDRHCAGWEVVCPDGRVRNYPYHNLGDAESHARHASDPAWFAKRRCRLAPEPGELELLQPPCPGGRHEVQPIILEHITGSVTVIITPQFTRPQDEPGPASPPEDWDALRTLDALALTEIGLRRWSCREGLPTCEDGCQHKKLWLFPGEWYRAIPPGYNIVSLSFQTELFQPGVTDDDIRYGMLPYGIMGPP